ncbi:ribonuclease Z [Geobacter sp. OR-1]|uniref:ribonuclease Z n=1 Tax=Geobacter sp. OR-1 TaxID=1266765 RepID=UPI000544000C|nr:MBL fold metallo-hydrolase [Geobacter sp. OR-1]GAM08751.1 ribonuclease Z [Geobacter sp. OR-1]
MSRLFRYLEPAYLSGLIEDPCLIVRDRPIHRSIMIDCGSLHHLAKRELKPVMAIFVSHAHMDHFMGFDAFVRQVHASPRTIEMFGPPGFAARVSARLNGYDWNLCEPYWCSFIVREIHSDRTVSFEFHGPSAFRCEEAGEQHRTGDLIYRHNHIEVSARLFDHGIPVLAFRVNERKIFGIDAGKLAEYGLVQGEWLRELKKRYFREWAQDEPISVTKMAGGCRVAEPVADAEALYAVVCAAEIPAGIGYVTDIGFSPENREGVVSFLQGVELLVCECAFLKADMHKARASRHLCTKDLNELLDRLRPRLFLAIHLSKTYLDRSEELYAELSPPPGTKIIRIPEHVAPRPVYSCDVTRLNSDRFPQ